MTEPIIEKNDGSIVIYVANDATNGLVDCSLRLQCVPCLPIHRAFPSPELTIEEVFLYENFWIEDLRVRDACHDDSPGSIVGKVDTFGQLTPTDGKEGSFAFCGHCREILVEHCLVFLLILIFNVDISLLLNQFEELVRPPHLLHLVQDDVGGQEN